MCKLISTKNKQIDQKKPPNKNNKKTQCRWRMNQQTFPPNPLKRGKSHRSLYMRRNHAYNQFHWHVSLVALKFFHSSGSHSPHAVRMTQGHARHFSKSASYARNQTAFLLCAKLCWAGMWGSCDVKVHKSMITTTLHSRSC